MTKNFKKTIVLSIAAGISLFSMSFNTRTDDNEIVESIRTTKKVDVGTPLNYVKSEKTGAIVGAAVGVVVVWVADSSWALLLLEGQGRNIQVNPAENESFNKKMTDVKQHQLDARS